MVHENREPIDPIAAELMGISAMGDRLEDRSKLQLLGQSDDLIPPKVRANFEKNYPHKAHEQVLGGDRQRMMVVSSFPRITDEVILRRYYGWIPSSGEESPQFKTQAGLCLNAILILTQYSESDSASEFLDRLPTKELRDRVEIGYSELSGSITLGIIRQNDGVKITFGREKYVEEIIHHAQDYDNIHQQHLLLMLDRGWRVLDGKNKQRVVMKDEKGKYGIKTTNFSDPFSLEGAQNVYEKTEETDENGVTWIKIRRSDKKTGKVLDEITCPAWLDTAEVKNMLIDPILYQDPSLLPSEFPTDEKGEAIDLDEWRNGNYLEYVGVTWERGEE